MALTLRRKVTIILLALYWPGLFTLAHIPIPHLVRQAGVSDKGVHFLSCLILVLLLWFSISFDRKVDWRRARGWLVFCLLVLYSVFDELSQDYVGRNCDIMDLVLDVAGTLTGLLLFSFFTFWPSALLVTGIVIFGITNITRVNLADMMPIVSAAFHLSAYGVFTVLWIINMRLFRPVRVLKIRWLLSALIVPIVFLLTVKIFSLFLGRVFDVLDVIISIGAIVIVTGVVFLPSLYHKTTITKYRTGPEPAQD